MLNDEIEKKNQLRKWHKKTQVNLSNSLHES
jgi:hypothetical protein